MHKILNISVYSVNIFIFWCIDTGRDGKTGGALTKRSECSGEIWIRTHKIVKKQAKYVIVLLQNEK